MFTFFFIEVVAVLIMFPMSLGTKFRTRRIKTNSENNYSANVSWNLNEKDEKMNGQKSEKNFFTRACRKDMCDNYAL